jgi:hypothetical protein
VPLDAAFDERYDGSLCLHTMEPDRALLKLAQLQARPSALRTRLSGSSSRAKVGFITRELDPVVPENRSQSRCPPILVSETPEYVSPDDGGGLVRSEWPCRSVGSSLSKGPMRTMPVVVCQVLGEDRFEVPQFEHARPEVASRAGNATSAAPNSAIGMPWTRRSSLSRPER